MMMRLADIAPGAYTHDPQTGRLYELGACTAGVIQLLDVAADIDDPRTVQMTTAVAVTRLNLVRHAPHRGDTASAAEWGKAGLG